ncbi:hypothetical protein [uncultured Winogradskyella sp.]|uniref:hypothetical protein n=1 Tax=uncultured Winogradskyella sp. TaxID=395353 RepID=UPI00260D41F0|nr:hypothetical protein [uncultured Winogradskyella sp.]
MKKCVLGLTVLFIMLTSCSVDEGSGPDFSFQFMPIESVEVPQEFIHGETYTINVNYTQPNDCYEFNSFAYDVNDQERTIAVVNTVYNTGESTCPGEPALVSVGFDFTVTSTNTYVFKFYQGGNDDGVDQYHIVEVPVTFGRQIVDPKH